MTERVLVTGGAGFIGSHVCKALASFGYEPITFDNLCRGNKWAVKWGPLEFGDIRDEFALGRVFRSYRPIGVIHLAAFAYVGESVQYPEKYHDNNVVGSQILIRQSAEHGAGGFVFSSSCTVYGNAAVSPISEKSKIQPQNPYGETKAAVEKQLFEGDTAKALPAVALRYFNAAGCDPDTEIGEAHEPETHLIPLLLAAAKEGTVFTVNGDGYATKDGTCVRDYIHVADLARAHILALEYLINGGQSRAFNLATGKGFSILDIIESVRTVTGKSISYRIGPPRAGDVASLIGDSGDAQYILEWIPIYPTLEDQLLHAWNWMTRDKKSRG